MPATKRVNLSELNPEQRVGATSIDGPTLVLAGAGTGKTRVITYRVAYLLEQGVSPKHILAMTFTNKAAAEMRERIGRMVGKEAAGGLTIGTFHSFCARTLRVHAEALGLPKAFSICDASDQATAVKGALRDLHIPEAALHPRAAQAKISLMKNRLITPEEFLESAVDEYEELLGRTYRRYEEHLRRSRVLDFDDLLLFTVKLLREADGARTEISERYRQIMVDEYQDTNGPQYEIVRLIAKRWGNLCVVGDDDQSIYGWRGADVRKILAFDKDYPGTTVVRLETNYRSTHPILDAANTVIRNNLNRHEKALRSSRGEGDPILIYEARDEEEEAEFVVRSILERCSTHRSQFGDFAILFRTQVQPRTFEARLRASQVPYVLVGGMSFFDRKEVRDILAYLKLIANPKDEASLLRIVNTPPRGIGKTTVDRIVAFATERGISAGEAFERVEEIEGLPRAAGESAKRLLGLFRDLARYQEGEGLVALVQKLIQAVDYKSEVERCYNDAMTRETRWAGVTEVLNFAENYVRRAKEPTLLDFLEELSLTANDDRTQEDSSRRKAVTLMTLHAAKGLEFPQVYIAGCEEGILPHQRSVEEDTIDEERRLMYVGITRAQERLVISHAAERARYGTRVLCTPSRFLFELLECEDEGLRDGDLPDRLPDHPKFIVARQGERPTGPKPKSPTAAAAPSDRKPGPFSGRPFRGPKKKD